MSANYQNILTCGSVTATICSAWQVQTTVYNKPHRNAKVEDYKKQLYLLFLVPVTREAKFNKKFQNDLIVRFFPRNFRKWRSHDFWAYTGRFGLPECGSKISWVKVKVNPMSHVKVRLWGRGCRTPVIKSWRITIDRYSSLYDNVKYRFSDK